MLQKGWALASLVWVGALAPVLAQRAGGPADSAQTCACVLSGQVTDSAMGQGLGVAYVSAQGKTTVADEHGHFALTGLCAGTAAVEARLLGYHTKTVSLRLGPGGNRMELRLSVHYQDDEQVEVVGYREGPSGAGVSRIGEEQIQAAAGDPLAAMLSRQTGVNLLRTGPTVVKPVIQGLSGSRVLVLNAGVRHEGQQWGQEHAPELDPLASGKLTLVRGAATVRYGPEALGGVIIAEPAALPDSAGLSGGVTVAGASNNGMGTASGWLVGAVRKVPGLAFRVQGTVRRAGDSRAPGYVLSNTGLAELNGSYQLGYKRGRWLLEADYAQFTTKLGILFASQTGSVADLYHAIGSDRPSEVYGFSYKIQNPYQAVVNELGVGKAGYRISRDDDRTMLRLQLARQFNDRREYDRGARFGVADPESKPALVFTLTTWSGEALIDHRIGPGLQVQAGLAGYAGRKTGGFDVTSTRFLLRSLIPDYETLLLGAFGLVKGRRGRWGWELGARVDRKSYLVQAGSWPGYGRERLFVLPSATATLNRALAEGLVVDGSLSTSARPPSVAELYSRGLHQGAAAIEVGSPALNAERMQAAQLGLSLTRARWRMKSSAYLHYFQGFINRIPQLPPATTIAGTFPVFIYQGQDALMRGVDVEAALTPKAGLELGASASLVRAKAIKSGEWLQQMPADRLRAWAEGRAGRPLLGFLQHAFARVEGQQVLRQSRPGNLLAESLDYAPAPGAYFLLNAQVGAEFAVGKRMASFSIEGQNMLNRRYRDYLDSFRYFADAPGRNLIARVTVPLGT